MVERGILGIFVGGEGRRLGGYPKGLLCGPDGTRLVEQHLDVARALSLEPVWVGAESSFLSLYRAAYPEVLCLRDATDAVGPIAGLRALLAYAQDRTAYALACDMPRFDQRGIEALQNAPTAAIVASRVFGSDKWNPFPARYQGADALLEEGLAAGVRSFQGLFSFANAQACDLRAEILVDVDTPEDAAEFSIRKMPYWPAAAASTRTTAL